MQHCYIFTLINSSQAIIFQYMSTGWMPCANSWQ